MGHSISYHTFSYKTKQKDIFEDICAWAYDPQESGGYHGNLTFHENRIYECKEDAEEAIRKFDKGWYDDHAVLFKDCSAVKPTKEMNKILEQLNNERLRLAKIKKETSIQNLTSEFIGCKKCGSKLNLKLLYSNCCPLCSNDLRSNTSKKRIDSCLTKISELNNKYQELEKKLADKAPTCWLVKVEYHC